MPRIFEAPPVTGRKLLPLRNVGACVAALGLMLLACNDSAGPERAVAEIVIVGSTEVLAPTTTRQLTAALFDADGRALEGRTVTWTSDNPAAATVAPTGIVTGVAPGSTTIRAASGVVDATLTIVVEYPTCTSAMASGSIAVGQVITGTFTHAGCARSGLGPYRGYAFTLEQRTGVSARLHSPGATSWVLISPMVGPDLATAASTTPGDTAQASADLPAGSYVVWGRTQDGVLGNFRLQLNTISTCFPSNASNGALAPTDSVAGSLDSGSCILVPYNRAEGWTMTLDTATSVQLDATATAYLPDVIVTDTLLNLVAWAATGSSTATLVDLFPPGRYLVWVTKLNDPLGSFSLRRRDYFTQLCDSGPSAGDLELGVPVNSALTGTDCRLVDTRYADRWRLVVPSDTTVRLDLAPGGAINPYLYLFDAAGTLLAEDDDSGGDYAARITRQLSAGTYWVMATSKRYDAVWASYLLSATMVAAPLTP